MPSFRGILWAASCGTERDKRNQYRILYWAAPWMATWLAALVTIKRDLLPSTPWAAVVVVLVLAFFGIGTIMAYGRFLREADELQRKIELDALALAFGVTLIVGLTGYVVGQMGLLETDQMFNRVMVLMLVTYSAGVIFGHYRFAS